MSGPREAEHPGYVYGVTGVSNRLPFGVVHGECAGNGALRGVPADGGVPKTAPPVEARGKTFPHRMLYRSEG
jgi:hypothetical protein